MFSTHDEAYTARTGGRWVERDRPTPVPPTGARWCRSERKSITGQATSRARIARAWLNPPPPKKFWGWKPHLQKTRAERCACPAQTAAGKVTKFDVDPERRTVRKMDANGAKGTGKQKPAYMRDRRAVRERGVAENGVNRRLIDRIGIPVEAHTGPVGRKTGRAPKLMNSTGGKGT